MAILVPVAEATTAVQLRAALTTLAAAAAAATWADQGTINSQEPWKTEQWGPGMVPLTTQGARQILCGA